MINKNRLLLAAALAGATALTSFSAQAFWGPFNPWNWTGPGYGGWGGPWNGYGYPGYWGRPYGWGGYPGAWGGYPGYGYGYPAYGYGYGYPLAYGAPAYSYPSVTAPLASTESK